MLHQWFTYVHLLDTYLANLTEDFQLSFTTHLFPSEQHKSGLQSAPACRMRWVCHHLFRSYDRSLSNIANIRLHSVSGHTSCCKYTKKNQKWRQQNILRCLFPYECDSNLNRIYPPTNKISPSFSAFFKLNKGAIHHRFVAYNPLSRQKKWPHKTRDHHFCYIIFLLLWNNLEDFG